MEKDDVNKNKKRVVTTQRRRDDSDSKWTNTSNKLYKSRIEISRFTLGIVWRLYADENLDYLSAKLDTIPSRA